MVTWIQRYTYHGTMDTETYIPWYHGYRDIHTMVPWIQRYKYHGTVDTEIYIPWYHGYRDIHTMVPWIQGTLTEIYLHTMVPADEGLV